MSQPDLLHIALLADHSAQRLGKLIETELARQGVSARCHLGEGDDGVSEGMDDASPLFAAVPSIAFISLSTTALREKFYSTHDVVLRSQVAEAMIEQIDALVERLHQRQIRVLVTTLSAPLERMFGQLAPVVQASLASQVRRINNYLHSCAAESRLLLVDVEHLASTAGLSSWYDERLWYHAKYPCHPRHLPAIASAFGSVVRAIRGRVIKCIVLDLDNTLWGGVIGDDGVEGIALGGIGHGEAFRDFQRYLKIQQQRGIILCVCSKNEEANALLPFRGHDAMVLKEEDIALFVANWQPKSENLTWIASTLNIGLDSIVFIDDSPFEREEVRRALPSVQVPEMPEDPSLFVRTLELAALFEATAGPTQEDAVRTSLYQAEGVRRKLQAGAANAEEYLASLEITGTFQAVAGQHVQRAAQLIGRSNQFNLRTQRISQEQLSQWTADPARPCFCISLRDRFGDYGMIAVLCCEVRDDEVFIHEFVMSCRVLARGVEQFILNSLATHASQRGLKSIVGEYLPTAKNSLVADLYPRLGFLPLPDDEGRWRLELENFHSHPTHVGEPILEEQRS